MISLSLLRSTLTAASIQIKTISVPRVYLVSTLALVPMGRGRLRIDWSDVVDERYSSGSFAIPRSRRISRLNCLDVMYKWHRDGPFLIHREQNHNWFGKAGNGRLRDRLLLFHCDDISSHKSVTGA